MFSFYYESFLALLLIAGLALAVLTPLYLLWKIIGALRQLLTETDRLNHNLIRLTETMAKTTAEPTSPPAEATPTPAPAPAATPTPTPVSPSATALPPQASALPPPLPPAGVSQPQAETAFQPSQPPPTPLTPPPPKPEQPLAPQTTPSTPEKPPAPPRQAKPWEIAARRKLRQAWNWFLCGQADGPGTQPLEKLAATTWLLRAGVCVILFTVGFMLKLSIHQGWLAPSGRVALTFVAGAALLFWSLRLLNGAYRVMGQAILGLALATFYFGAFAATGMYHLIGPILGFVVMVAITAAAGFMAVRFDSIAVAVIATVGGYATPILLETGSKNFPVLFAYMFILGIGVLTVAAYRDWLPLNWLGLFFTYTLFIGAWQTHYVPADFPVLITALTLFFVQYSTVVFIHNVAQKKPSSTLEIIALLANAALFTGCAYRLIATVTEDRLWFAPLTLSLAAFYVAHAFWFLRRKHHDRGLLLTFIGLSALFLTLTVPLVFAREWIGVTWSLLALLMLWLGQNLDSAFLRSAAWILYTIVIVRLTGSDFLRAYGRPQATLDTALFWRQFAERLVQFGAPLASLAAAARLASRPTPPGDLAIPPKCDLKPRPLPLPFPPTAIAVAIAAILFFLYCNFETFRTFGYLFPPFCLPAQTILWLLWGVAIFHVAARHPHPAWKALLLALIVIIVGKVIFWDFLSWSPCCRFRYATFTWTECVMRLVDFGPLIAFLIALAILLRDREELIARIAAILWPALLFLYSTWEVNTMLGHLMPKLCAGGISVLWGAFAAAFIYRGLTTSLRPLRYLGLALFAIVVGKVFLYDLDRLGNVHRVFAFLLFGLLLMAGAFFYLKFWQSDRSEKVD